MRMAQLMETIPASEWVAILAMVPWRVQRFMTVHCLASSNWLPFVTGTWRYRDANGYARLDMARLWILSTDPLIPQRIGRSCTGYCYRTALDDTPEPDTAHLRNQVENSVWNSSGGRWCVADVSYETGQACNVIQQMRWSFKCLLHWRSVSLQDFFIYLHPC